MNTAAVETWYDGVDQDCDGWSDDDADADGADASHRGGSDCDDTDPVVHPEASDSTVDGVDQDCDGVDGPRPDADEDVPTADADEGKGSCAAVGAPASAWLVLAGLLLVARRRPQP